MQFESLPNEFFLDLFEYFDIVHLLRAFPNLNSRFNALLYKHFRTYHLNLRRISKCDFDFLCEKHLYLISDRIISFYWADEEETPGLLQLFFAHGFNLSQFINLTSLTFEKIDTKNITKGLDELKFLVHLNITRCDISNDNEDTSYLINQIWNLPKLTYCKLDHCYPSEIYLDENTQISSTLEHLYFHLVGLRLTMKDLIYLFLHTSRLRVLSIYLQLFDENEKSSIVFTSITTLNIRFLGEGHILNNLFHTMPCLYRLKVDMETGILNGYEWQQIIINHLPKLQMFQFRMSLASNRINITEQQVDTLFNTFRTSFWLVEHQWYVRCDWENNAFHPINYGYLYTLPYAFKTFFETAQGIRRSKWTCRDDENCWAFNRVHIFEITRKSYWSRSINDRLYLHPAYFPNINELKCQFPLPGIIWHTISTLDHLTTLNLTILAEKSHSEFQALLNRTPHLYNLTINFLTDRSYMNILFEFLNPSIRRLHINPAGRHHLCAFDDLQCNSFAKSPLGQQCEVLEIQIQSLYSIVTLINSMNNIRAMKIHLPKCSQLQPHQAKIALMEWTQNHLPKGSWFNDDDHSEIISIIRLWIN